MDGLPDSPTYVTWLLGQSVAVVIQALWVMSLIREKKRSSVDYQALLKRNGELASSLVEVVVSQSQERASENELNIKSVLDAFERALQHKPDESE